MAKQLTIEISDCVHSLLEAGVITINVTFTEDGKEVWARPVKPHPKLGVTSYESMTLEDAENTLARVIAPRDVKGKGKASPSRVSFSSDTKGETERDGSGTRLVKRPKVRPANEYSIFRTIADIERFYESRNLGVTTEDGIEGKLPKDSLTWRELMRPNLNIMARAFYVSRELGNAKMAGRIATNKELFVANARTLHAWWKGANGEQRLTLLSTGTKLGRRRDGQDLDWCFDKLASIPCPFRDPEASLVEQERNDADEAEGSA